jgi:RNA polymerase sigma-70 factor (ECF subfamily)
MREPSDAAGQDLTAARAGSKEAIGTVLEQCRGYLLGIAERELDADLRSKGGASDLVQETFLEAQRDFAGFRGRTEADLLAWLRRLLLNNLANFARTYRRTAKRRLDREIRLPAGSESRAGESQFAADTPTPSAQVGAGEDTAALQAALGRLPADYREVITLRHIEGLSFDQIAERMGRSSAALRKLWSRAVERMQAEMEPPP